jgi:four helix bundle protein
MKKELEARTKRFALSVIQVVGKLPRGKASDVIGYQLLKSGTSIGVNYREVNRAQSHDDFIHKVAICEKEAAETEYWLELAMEANLIGPNTTAIARSSGTAGNIGCERPNCQVARLIAITPIPQSAIRNSSW